jgi:hypothetical protein
MPLPGGAAKQEAPSYTIVKKEYDRVLPNRNRFEGI